MNKSVMTAREFFEDRLQEHLRYNEANRVLPSESAVARRLLDRGAELAEVYNEIHNNLRDPISKNVLLSRFLSVGAFWSLERIAQDRMDREALVALNKEIAKRSYALADLLRQRDQLHNHSDFHSGTHYDIVEVIDEASEGNGRYAYYLKEPLAHLSGRFDMKYWPMLDSLVQVIGDDAERAKVKASDPLTDSATRSKRPSTADFTRALDAAIQDSRGSYSGGLPKDFMLSDQGLATLVNVLLDLPVDTMVDAVHVKNSRNKGKKLKSG